MNESTPESGQVKEYYDKHTAGKLKSFLEMNRRVEFGAERIEKCAPENPTRILEIGCGVGDICWRMSRHWPEAEVVGTDISGESIALAKKLFATDRVSFEEMIVEPGSLDGEFDLIVLMDVYEHLADDYRPAFHEFLNNALSNRGRIIVTVPTPRHQEFLRREHPDRLQPIDQDITVETFSRMAKDTNSRVILYEEIDVWHVGDYAHSVLGRGDFVNAKRALTRKQKLSAMFKLVKRNFTFLSAATPKEREQVVKKAFGDKKGEDLIQQARDYQL